MQTILSFFHNSNPTVPEHSILNTQHRPPSTFITAIFIEIISPNHISKFG